LLLSVLFVFLLFFKLFLHYSNDFECVNGLDLNQMVRIQLTETNLLKVRFYKSSTSPWQHFSATTRVFVSQWQRPDKDFSLLLAGLSKH
jgi:hypothetical protein